MLRSRSIPIEANHCIKYLYYFFYLILSNSTPFDGFLTGIDGLRGCIGCNECLSISDQIGSHQSSKEIGSQTDKIR